MSRSIHFSVLRMEESKLMDLLSTVSRKVDGVELKDKRIAAPYGRQKSMTNMTGASRPQISQAYREVNYNKNAINELKGLLDQATIDMQHLRESKDRDIEELRHKITAMV
jgi:hypothetical protein